MIDLYYSYQFVVKDDGDYSIHAADPDVLVDWDAIELIVRFHLVFVQTESADLKALNECQIPKFHDFKKVCIWKK